jgi:hypothetical protein
VGRVARDLVLPIVFKGLNRSGSQQWLFGHHIEWPEVRAHIHATPEQALTAQV